MTRKSTPKITPCSSKDYTKVTFVPDLEKFGMSRLDTDVISLFSKRVYDMAGVTEHSVKVCFQFILSCLSIYAYLCYQY